MRKVFYLIAMFVQAIAQADSLPATRTDGGLVTNLVEILVYVDEFSRTLDLDLPSPLTTNRVTSFKPYRGYADIAGVTLEGRWQFTFDVRRGLVNTFYDQKRSMGVLWRAEDIQPLIQPAKITKEQALEAARRYLALLGYPEKNMPLRPPKVNQWKWQPPGADKAESLPFFTIKWPWNKYPGWDYFTMEIDGVREKVVHFSTIYPRQAPPVLDTD